MVNSDFISFTGVLVFKNIIYQTTLNTGDILNELKKKNNKNKKGREGRIQNINTKGKNPKRKRSKVRI